MKKNYLKIILGIVLLGSYGFSNTSFAQVGSLNNDPELIAPEVLIGCGGNPVTISVEYCSDANYTWTQTNINGSGPVTNSGSTPNPATIQPSPTTTTTYTVKMEVGGIITTDFVQVKVIESILLLPEITIVYDYMEGQEITFFADISGVNLGIGIDNPLTVDFTYEYPDVNSPTGFTSITNSTMSFTNSGENMFVPINVPNSNSDHYYDLTISVNVQLNGFSCIVPPITVRIYTLWIDYVRDEKTDKEWKVIVSKKIEYKGTGDPSLPNTNHQWGFTDQWITTGGNSKEGNDLWLPKPNAIPGLDTSDNLPEKNSSFGDEFGIVYFNCTDTDGMVHWRYSDEQTVSKKAEVFYDGMQKYHSDAGILVPNWFYYYKDNDTNEAGGLYKYGCGGNTSYSAAGTNTDADIYICDNAFTGDTSPGRVSIYWEVNTTTGVLKITGKQNTYFYKSFVGVLNHERGHNQNQGTPASAPGYADEDCDGVSSAYEINPQLTLPMNQDSYIGSYPVDLSQPFPSGFPATTQCPGYSKIGGDHEAYVGSLVEQMFHDNADDSKDWAVSIQTPSGVHTVYGTNWVD